MKAYSLDLRQRIVEAYKNQEESVRSCARRFKVSPSYVQKLLKQHQQQGNLEPLAHGGGLPAKLALQEELVRQLLEEENDATLAQLCQKIEQRTGGINVSQSTLCRFLLRLNLTRKKTLYATQAGSERVQFQRVNYWGSVRDIALRRLNFH